MPERAHLSIGEVLSLLQDEFPDVTISKIRFLESQGLIDPERTPSGYRKFYEGDIEKLRWVLRQQRENFLPLKVIKDRLDEHGGAIPQEEPAPAGPEDRAVPGQRAAPGPTNEAVEAEPSVSRDRAPGAGTPVWMQDHARRAASREAATPPAPARSGGEPVLAGATGAQPRQGTDVSTVSLNEDELLKAAGLTPQQLRSLEQFGLIASRQVGPELLYDADSVVVAQKAAAFLGHGLEARHLRMFKVSAEREAGFLEQVVTPLLKQRNPGARRQAVVLLNELISLGDSIHAALLRHLLRDYLNPPG